jgi:hypothetical protein
MKYTRKKHTLHRPKTKHVRIRVRGRVGGGKAEHAAAQQKLVAPLWEWISKYMGGLPQQTQDKIKDILYRGGWDWISDH